MRLHDRYVFSLFLRVLLFCVLGFTIIFILIDVFEKLDNFIDNEASAWNATRFFLYKVPDMIRLTLPVDVLLAAMFTLGVLGRNNEIVGLLAGGVSLLRVSLPIIMVAMLTVALSGVLSEFVVPRTNDRMHEVRRVRIEKRAARDQTVRHDFLYHGRGGYLWFARRFNTQKEELNDVQVSFTSGGSLKWRVDAQRCTWKDQLWVFQNAIMRTFDVNGESVETFRQLKMPELLETPEELARLERKPDAMNYRELEEYVGRLHASGVQVHEYQVDLYAKLSYPFTPLIMALLGIGISASKRKPNIAAGFALTLFIAFSYLILVGLFEAFGKKGSMPPLLAAWSAPLMFAVASLWFLRRVNR